MARIKIDFAKTLGTAADDRRVGTEKAGLTKGGNAKKTKIDVAKTVGTAPDGRKTGTEKAGATKGKNR